MKRYIGIPFIHCVLFVAIGITFFAILPEVKSSKYGNKEAVILETMKCISKYGGLDGVTYEDARGIMESMPEKSTASDMAKALNLRYERWILTCTRKI